MGGARRHVASKGWRARIVRHVEWHVEWHVEGHVEWHESGMRVACRVACERCRGHIVRGTLHADVRCGAHAPRIWQVHARTSRPANPSPNPRQHKGKHGVSAHNKDIYVNRLRRAGVDLSRVAFVQQQPHHRLMALYSLADVVLDSYHAGGCTTTREALEVGAIVVTLPAKYLGSRWSAAYYTIMGVT